MRRTGRNQGLISSFDFSQFYHKTCQKFGTQTADTWYFQLSNSEFTIVRREESVRAAGVEKYRQSPNLSLSDCFALALALARAEGALLITTGGELAKIKDVGVRHIGI